MKQRHLTGDTAIHYWTYHDEQTPTIVMIHGFTGSHEGFQYIIPQLNDFRIITPDLPGFGESELNFSPWTVDELAKKTNEFVAGLKLETPPFLISHSLGGLVAASMLSQNPELFDKKTVFISPVATKIELFDRRQLGAFFGGLQYLIGKKTGRAGDRLVKSKRLSRLATRFIMTEQDPAKRATIYEHHYKNLDYISSVDYYHQLYRDINKRGALDYARALKQFTIQIIAGEKDNVTPLAGEKKLARELAAELEILGGVGHLSHYERPNEIATAVRRFLE